MWLTCIYFIVASARTPDTNIIDFCLGFGRGGGPVLNDLRFNSPEYSLAQRLFSDPLRIVSQSSPRIRLLRNFVLRATLIILIFYYFIAA